MNPIQKKIIWGGAALFLLMGLIPPWTDIQNVGGLPYSAPVGYSIIFAPPEGADKIDLNRLQIQWFMVIVITGVLAFTFNESRSRRAVGPEQRQQASDRRDTNDRRIIADRRQTLDRRVRMEVRRLPERRVAPDRRVTPDRRLVFEDRLLMRSPLKPERRYIPDRRENPDRRRRIEPSVKRERRTTEERRSTEDRRFYEERRIAPNRRTAHKGFFQRYFWLLLIGFMVSLLLFIFLLLPLIGPSKLTKMTVSERLQFRKMVTQVDLMRTFRGHEGFIRTIAFSPDSRYLASASYDQTVKIWDLASGAVVNTLIGHTDLVRAVAFSPQDSILASGSADRDIILWNYVTGQMLRTLEGHSERVRCLAFNHRGDLLASGSGDRTVKLWDVSSGEIMRSLEGHFDEVWTVAFNSDGSNLASGCAGVKEGEIRFWDVRAGRLITMLNGLPGQVMSLDFSPDDHYLAVGSGEWNNERQIYLDGHIAIWDLTSQQMVHTMKYHKTGAYISLDFSPDGKLLASGDSERQITLWDISRGKEVRILKGHVFMVSCVAFNREGTLLASSSGERNNMIGEIKIWGPFSNTTR